MNDTELTPGEQERWKAALAPFFAGVKSNATLARSIRGGREDTSLAGYIGEFRNGKRRGLVRLFGNPQELERLCQVLGCEPEQLTDLLQAIREERSTDSETLLLPGFEDWGPVSLEDGFVPPRQTRDGELGTLDELVDDSGSPFLSVTAYPGSGLTTVLRVIASRLRQRGWRTVPWSPYVRRTRGTFLILDNVRPGDDSVEAWRRDGYGGVLDGRHPDVPSQNVRSFQREGLAEASHAIWPVDADWLLRYRGVLLQLAPQRMKRALTRASDEAIRHIPELGHRLGPQGAGILLRSLVDGISTDLASVGPQRVIQAARRRLAAGPDRSLATDLQGAEVWLPGLGRQLLRDSDTPLAGYFEDAAREETRRVIDEVQATVLQRNILRRALPHASGQPVLDALLAADVLQEGQTTRLRHLDLLAPSIARAILDGEERDAVIDRLILDRDVQMVAAICDHPDGPSVVTARLDGLGPAAFHHAFGHPHELPAVLELPVHLVERWIADHLVLGSGRRDVQVDPGWVMEISEYRFPYRRLRPALRRTRGRPDPDRVVQFIRLLQEQTGMLEWEPTSAEVVTVTALLVPSLELLRREEPWTAMALCRTVPGQWTETLLAATEGHQIALDGSRYTAAGVIGRYAPAALVAIALEGCSRGPQQVARWLSASVAWSLERVAEGDGRPSPHAGPREFAHALIRGVRVILEDGRFRRYYRVIEAELQQGLAHWHSIEVTAIDDWVRDLAVLVARTHSRRVISSRLDRAGVLRPGWVIGALAGGSEKTLLAHCDEPLVQQVLMAAGSERAIETVRGARPWADLEPLRELACLNPYGRAALWQGVQSIDDPEVWWLHDSIATVASRNQRRQKKNSRLPTLLPIAELLEVDRGPLSALCDSSSVPSLKGGAVIDWGLSAGVDAEVLLGMLTRTDPTILLEITGSKERSFGRLVQLIQTRDTAAVDAWLVGQLERGDRRVDSRLMAPIWRASGISDEELAELLDRFGLRGGGVLGGLLRRDQPAESWLGEQGPDEALIAALTADKQYRGQLKQALARFKHCPSEELLKTLIEADARDALGGLDVASREWTREETLELWMQLARLDGERREIYLQMAAWYEPRR